MRVYCRYHNSELNTRTRNRDTPNTIDISYNNIIIKMQSMISIAYKYTIKIWRLTLGRVTIKVKKKLNILNFNLWYIVNR